MRLCIVANGIDHHQTQELNMRGHRTTKILVINGKGGCGKTTIASNLAVAYAHANLNVALFDYDAQASSTHWWQQRSPELPRINLVQAYRRTGMYSTRAFQTMMPADTQVAVVDTPSAVAERDLDDLLRGVQVILVPLVPSAIDLRAAVNFISTLVKHRNFRTQPVPIGLIANRARRNTIKLSNLLGVTEGLELPLVASFRDSPLYTQLAEDGTGLFDLSCSSKYRDELAQWQQLLDWVERARQIGEPARAERILKPAPSLVRA